MRRFASCVSGVGFSVVVLFGVTAGCDNRSSGEPRNVVGDPPLATEPTIVTKAPAPADVPKVPADDEKKWGTVKGKVVWGEKEMPKPVALMLGAPAAVPACVPPAGLFSEEFVIDPKTKGVRNVFVWLASPDAPKKKGAVWAPIPIHPTLTKSTEPAVTLNQPCCTFLPRAIAMRDDQVLHCTNGAVFAHNLNCHGENNFAFNVLIAPGGVQNVNVPAKANLISVHCNIHPWMNAYVRVFDHPYFALTGENGTFEIKNAPAGDYRILIWHEGVGWVAFDDPERRKDGKLIKIKGGEANDLGEFKVVRED